MFKDSVVLRSGWNDEYVCKQIRRNLDEGDDRAFMVTSGTENQRAVVKAFLDKHETPHAFFFGGEDGEPHKWRCLVGRSGHGGGIGYIPGDGPPEVLSRRDV